MSKLTAVFVVVASLSFGQAAPAGTATKAQVTASPVSAPASSSSAQAPDLTYKPGPQDAPAPAPPAVPPAAVPTVPDTPVATPKPAEGDATDPANNSGNKSASDTTVLPKLVELPHYVLGANDVVGVTVYGESMVPGTYAIGPDGRISVPLIGDFTVVGLTIPQLKELITQKLSATVVDPVVNVQLLRNNSKKYTIIGGVGRQGSVPLLEETTVLDALANCGGFHEFANQKDITIHRGTKTYKFNYKDAVQGKNMKQNIPLQDGDIIVVKE